jgi:hypothetical protein
MKLPALTSLVAAYALLMITGCGQQSAGPVARVAATHDQKHDHDHDHAAHEHHHDSWWCDEHGVPEKECGLCDSKLAAEFQRKGDWCQKHDRPASQCFDCNPALAQKFAAKYEAKYGEPPPKADKRL